MVISAGDVINTYKDDKGTFYTKVSYQQVTISDQKESIETLISFCYIINKEKVDIDTCYGT